MIRTSHMDIFRFCILTIHILAHFISNLLLFSCKCVLLPPVVPHPFSANLKFIVIVNKMELDPDWASQIRKINTFYLSTVCHVCKMYKATLKRCSGCKLYAYCSTDHQKYHWPDHKLFCKMVKKFLSSDGKNRRHVFDIDNIPDKSDNEWKQMKMDLAFLWEMLIGRDLTPGENQLWMYPRICEICKYSHQDSLIDCTNCFSYSYCSIAHKNEHEIHTKYCSLLRHCYEINFCYFNGKPKVNFNLFNISSDLKCLPVDMASFIVDLVQLDKKYVDVLASELISPMMTILYALEKCGVVLNRRFIKDSLVIHVVGAAKYEQNLPWDIICEIAFHWVLNLNSLNIILIGPQVVDELLEKKQLCSDCVGKNYTICIERDYYHDCVNLLAPDLIVAFNCGLHEYQDTEKDTWQYSIDSLLNKRSNIPLVLTSYTREEAQFDFARLATGADFETIVKHEMNPYKDLKPVRDWDVHDSPIFYKNNYVTIIKTC